MRKVLVAGFLLFSTCVYAQKPTHGINMAGQLILNRGTTLPATCTIGEVFFKTDASAGSNVYGCTATNTWTAQAGGTVSAAALDAIEGPGADLCITPTVNGSALEFPFDKTCLESLAFTDTGYRNASGGSWRPPEKTVSTLPTASSNTGKVYVATDGTSSSDCTTGSSSTRALCVSNGSSWVSLGGSGGASWTKYTIGEAALAAAGTSAHTLFSLTAQQVIRGVTIKHSTAFTGGSVSAMTVSVGSSTVTDYYCPALDIFATASNTGFERDSGVGKATFAADNVTANFICTGANCSAATAGSVDIYVLVETLP